MWRADSEETYSREGRRTFDVSQAAAVRASRQALENIGLRVISANEIDGVVQASRPHGPKDLSQGVISRELPRVRRIMAEELGDAGKNATLTNERAVLFANIRITSESGQSLIEPRFCNATQKNDGALLMEPCVIDTASLEKHLEEFWGALVKYIEDATPRRRQLPPPPAIPRSEWIIPGQ